MFRLPRGFYINTIFASCQILAFCPEWIWSEPSPVHSITLPSSGRITSCSPRKRAAGWVLTPAFVLRQKQGQFNFFVFVVLCEAKAVTILVVVVKRTAWHPCLVKEGAYSRASLKWKMKWKLQYWPQEPCSDPHVLLCVHNTEEDRALQKYFPPVSRNMFILYLGPRNSKYYLISQFSHLKREESILFVWFQILKTDCRGRDRGRAQETSVWFVCRYLAGGEGTGNVFLK